MLAMRYWMVGLLGAVVPAVYLRRYMLSKTAAAGQRTNTSPPRKPLWRNLSDNYNKVPESEAIEVIFSSIM